MKDLQKNYKMEIDSIDEEIKKKFNTNMGHSKPIFKQ